MASSDDDRDDDVASDVWKCLCDFGIDICDPDADAAALKASALARLAALVANLNEPIDEFGPTPCQLAAMHADPRVVALLIGRVDVNVPDWNGVTPLFVAAEQNTNDAVLSALIAAGATVDVRASESQATPLISAAQNARNVKIIDVLLEAGADVNAADAQGITPIFRAALHENPCVFDRLVAAGANLRVRASDDLSLLHWSTSRGNARITKKLIAEKVFAVDVRNAFGNTPLHHGALSVYEGVSECMAALILAGADVNARGVGDGTALHCAGREGNSSAVSLLIAAGASLSLVNADGRTPREEADESGSAETFDLACQPRAVQRAGFIAVRERATEICVALRGLELDALRMSEILAHSCAPFGLDFHWLWDVAVTVKHWSPERQR